MLRKDWKFILKNAWSVRFLIFASVLSGLEAIFPFFRQNFSEKTFAILMFLIVAFALISRIIAQKEFKNEK